MRFLFAIAGIVAALFGAFVFLGSKSAIHEIEAGIFFILAALCLGFMMLSMQLPPKD